MTSTTIGSDGQYELRERQAEPKRQLIRTADELVRALEVEPHRVAFNMWHLNRFGGQIPECNVLKHSLRVYETIPHANNATKIWALLHDCHEIITGDLVRPFKSVRLTRAQTEIDAVLQARFCPSITAVDIEVVQFADVATGDAELREWESGIYKFYSANWMSEWCSLFRKLRTS